MTNPNLQPTDKSKNTQPGLISDINKPNAREIDSDDKPPRTYPGETP